MGKLIRAISENGMAVCYALDSTDMAGTLERYHQTSAVVTAAAGRLLTAASIMGAMLKGEKDSVTLRITADEMEGKVTSPQSSATPARRPITMRGAVRQLKSMAPSALGLPGDSMDSYEIIPLDGTEMVNGSPAIRMHVYSSNQSTGGNDIMGSYLMTIDGEHLYQIDPVTHDIIELDYTPQ